MPDAPPEMMATLPASLMAVSPFASIGRLSGSCSVPRNGANIAQFMPDMSSTSIHADGRRETHVCLSLGE
jgi:hypothetical protein